MQLAGTNNFKRRAGILDGVFAMPLYGGFGVYVKMLLVAVSLLLGSQAFATTDSLSTNTDFQKASASVDAEQQRIDLFDGSEDNKVDLGDSVITLYAERVYFSPNERGR